MNNILKSLGKALGNIPFIKYNSTRDIILYLTIYVCLILLMKKKHNMPIYTYTNPSLAFQTSLNKEISKSTP